VSASFCRDLTAVIADTEDTSTPVAVFDATRGSFSVGADFAGNVDIEVSNDGTNWAPLDTAAGITYEAFSPTDGAPYIIPAEAFHFRRIRFKSSSAQTADNTITVTLMGS